MKKVLIFGAGKVGQAVIRTLEREYRILSVVDNDEKKWGSSLKGYTIKPPDEVLRQNCDVIIASTDYLLEIIQQLQEMGVQRDKIYFVDGYFFGDSFEYEISPVDLGEQEPSGKKLLQFDLLKTEERKSDSIKVLVLTTYYSVYAKQLIENMSKRYRGIEFSILTNSTEYREKICAEQLKHIYYFRTMADIKTILEQLPVYDAMQLLWIEREWAYLYKLIRKKTKRLNLNVGGSDFYRARKIERDFKKELIACADTVTAETLGTVRAFQEYYGEIVENKLGLLPFGIEVLEFIKSSGTVDKKKLREKYHIPAEKIVVTCGHNAHEMHQHLEIISALDKLQPQIKEKIICVFPMTYPTGKEKYIHKVRGCLEEYNIDYLILTEFMDFQGMAEYALISDIMIHVQTTDQLSSTMLEEMYAGSVVIAGSWLPYQSLHDMGIYFLDINNILDLAKVLPDIVTNLNKYQGKCEKNKEIVWKHSSWDELAPKWRALWRPKGK